MPRVRRPTHAGSWYDDDSDVLTRKIDAWLEAVPPQTLEGSGRPAVVRAIIGPHAGFRFCGHVMAHAYAAVDASSV